MYGPPKTRHRGQGPVPLELPVGPPPRRRPGSPNAVVVDDEQSDEHHDERRDAPDDRGDSVGRVIEIDIA